MMSVKYNQEIERPINELLEAKKGVSNYGHNPDDFTIVQIEEYRDMNNDKKFLCHGKKYYAVPNEISDDVSCVYWDFTHTGVDYCDEGGVVLLRTVGIGYDDIVSPTAFAMDDLLSVTNIQMEEFEVCVFCGEIFEGQDMENYNLHKEACRDEYDSDEYDNHMEDSIFE